MHKYICYPENAAQDDDINTYRNDRISLGVSDNNSYSDSDLFLVKYREVHISPKENSNLSTKNECNTLESFLNPTKLTKPKNGHF